ncbi:LysM peptidoglycan-binding domain-containing protein [Desertimonas flava]|uniref:LysM peptidoglycan-binding domain-containing protein n=1 Tax=Desertimonas flava TaxID=2064846 RepID=UPI000E345794|nr:transglycosylase SLT domain-containing protein [Desertimonas flava]
MTDFFDDDDTGFWETKRSEPTIQLNRVRKAPERTRTHRVVEKDPTSTRGLARTGSVPRTGAMRTHGEPAGRDDDTGTVWIEPTTGAWPGLGRRSRRRTGLLGSVDPRLLSVGALSVAAVLAVPLFGALGDKDSPDDVRSVAAASTSTIATTATTLAPTTTAVVITAPVTADDDSGSSSRSAGAGDAPADETGGMSTGSGSGGGSSDGESAGSGVLAAPAVRVAAQCGNPYEVASGDYWMGIANKIDYPLAQLLEYNEATSDTPLYPGSIVCLPLGTSIAPPTTAAPATTAAPSPAPTTAAPTTAAPAATDAPETTVATTQPATTEAPETTSPPATTQAPDEDDDDRPSGPVPSGGEVEQMIREIWPDDQEERALQIAWRESNYRPDVTSRTGCCHGVFQIHEQHLSWLADYGITSVSQLFDARTNIQAAYYLYQRSGGWGPWALG